MIPHTLHVPLALLAALTLGAACTPPTFAGRQSSLPKPEAVADYVPAFRRAPEPTSPCGPPVPGAEGLLQAGGRLLLGEIYGTTEMPTFVGQLACHAAHAGVPVVVALELPVEERESLAAFLASDGGEAARAALLSRAVWRRPDQDGRTSVAVLGLLERLRTLRAGGRQVSVEAYAETRYLLQGNAKQEALARNLLAVHAQNPGALLVGLSGNVNVRRARGTPWDATLVPMGLRVAPHLPGLVVLDAHFGPGSAWVCKSAPGVVFPVCQAFPVAEPRRARDRPFGTEGRLYQGERAFIERGPGAAAEGYDGIFYVGTITASPPAWTE